MKVMLLGKNGQLGSFLSNLFINEGIKFLGYGREDIDFNDKHQIEEAILKNKFSVVVNCIAYTNVEEAENNLQDAMLANETIPKIIASACSHLDCTLIHFSTDYVFNGKKMSPYKENDHQDPLNNYGASKLKGEKSIAAMMERFIIFRISWLYDLNCANSFPSKILKQISKNKKFSVINDQKSSPTSVSFIGNELVYILKNKEKMLLLEGKILHLSPNGSCSWFDFASEILKYARINLQNTDNIEISPCKSSELILKAKRPSNSKLDSSCYQELIRPLLNWKSDFQKHSIEIKS
jgi:dTDP-4-dehydrorhamnose reductase